MKTAHDTLKESGVSERFISSYAGTAVEISMISYARQALEEAASRAEVKEVANYDANNGVMTWPRGLSYTVDKQSILQIISELK
jgi:hypothetical protein